MERVQCPAGFTAARFARVQSAGGCTKRGFSGNCSLYIYKARRGQPRRVILFLRLLRAANLCLCYRIVQVFLVVLNSVLDCLFRISKYCFWVFLLFLLLVLGCILHPVLLFLLQAGSFLYTSYHPILFNFSTFFQILAFEFRTFTTFQNRTFCSIIERSERLVNSFSLYKFWKGGPEE